MITSGGAAGCLMGRATPSRICLSSDLRSCLSSPPPWMPVRRARWRRFSMTMAVVGAPRSAARSRGSRLTRVVSSTSRVSATMELMDSVNDSRVRVTASFMRSKKPRLGSCGSGALGWSGSGGRLPKMEKTMLVLVYRIGQRGGLDRPLCDGEGSEYLLAHDEDGAVCVYLGL